MSQDARITLTGSLGGDPELAYTQSGLARCKFTVACQERKKDASGNYVDRAEGPTWIDVTAWREVAENAAESLRKGDRVTVIGTVTLDVWEKDGEKRSRHTVTAEEVAPSLRWAQAKPQKVGKTGGGGRQGGVPSEPMPQDVPFLHSYGEV